MRKSQMVSHSFTAVQWYYNDANTVNMKIKVYCDIMLCTLVQKAEEALGLLQPACGHSNIPQMSVTIYQTAWCHIPGVFNLHGPLWKPQIPHY
jgi:hypothetical protein